MSTQKKTEPKQAAPKPKVHVDEHELTQDPNYVEAVAFPLALYAPTEWTAAGPYSWD